MKKLLIALSMVLASASMAAAGSQVSTKTANKYAGYSKAGESPSYGSRLKVHKSGGKYIAGIYVGNTSIESIKLVDASQLFGLDISVNSNNQPKLSVDYNNKILQEYILKKFQKGKGNLDVVEPLCRHATKYHYSSIEFSCSYGADKAALVFNNYYNTGRVW